METKTSAEFTPEQLDILIDCLHERFCTVREDLEPMPPGVKARLLDELSRLHAVVQFAAERAEARRGSRGQA